MKRVYLAVFLLGLVAFSALAGVEHSSRLLSPGAAKVIGGFSDFGLRVGILSFLESGWFMNEGPYFAFGYDKSFHIASRVSFSSLEEARIVGEFGYDFNLVYLEVGALYEYSVPSASFLGGHLKGEIFFDNDLSIVSAELGRFQKVAGETEKTSYTSIAFGANRKFPISKKFYFINFDSVEVLGKLSWEIEDDLSRFDPFPAYTFVGVQFNISLSN